MIAPRRAVSITTGCLSALGAFYVGLDKVWAAEGFMLPYPDAIDQTIDNVVRTVSIILATVTGASIVQENKGDK